MDTDHKAHKRSQLDFISPPVLCVTIQLEQGLVSAVRSIGPLPASNVVKPLFQLCQTQYFDIHCKLFWTMECACKTTQG